MVLTMLTALLRSIPYPLLPHMTVHKPIANLISVAVRYDAMHMSTTAGVVGKEAETFNKAEYTAYKKRIGEYIAFLTLHIHCGVASLLIKLSLFCRDWIDRASARTVAQVFRKSGHIGLFYI